MWFNVIKNGNKTGKYRNKGLKICEQILYRKNDVIYNIKDQRGHECNYFLILYFVFL